MFDAIAKNIPYHQINILGVDITIKRLDLVHPQISGNKFFKLKYNFEHAKQLGFNGVLTFGGAYSNHIAATAYAAKLFGFKSIGIIRGDELATKPLNPTLATAQQFDMNFQFISRQQYQQKATDAFLQNLQQNYPDFYVIPEGGTNELAIKGCKEILSIEDKTDFDVICCAAGTGGTLSGIIEASDTHQKIIGFSALKGDFLKDEISQFTQKSNWQITDEFCFGGYAKTHPQLFDFIKSFEDQYNIPLEQVYTAKMMFGLTKLIERNEITKESRVLVIHTGGLQGRHIQE
jgi:1-aminocyclopropane-1-carboxylate deaminase